MSDGSEGFLGVGEGSLNGSSLINKLRPPEPFRSRKSDTKHLRVVVEAVLAQRIVVQAVPEVHAHLLASGHA